MKMNMETYTNGVVKVKENLGEITLEAKKLRNGKTIKVASEQGMTFKRVHGQPGQYIASHPFGASTDDVIAGLEMLKNSGYLESYTQFVLDFQLQFAVNQGLTDIKGREIFYNPPDSAEFQRLARNPKQEVMEQFCCYLNASVQLRTIPFHTNGSEPKVHDGKIIYEGYAGQGWLNYLAGVQGPGKKISIGMSPSWLHTGRAKGSRDADEKSASQMLLDAKIPTPMMPAKGSSWKAHFGLNVNEAIRGYYIDVGMHDGYPTLFVVETKKKENSNESNGIPPQQTQRKARKARVAKASRGTARRK
jgi:hypothetical protein